jgi:putative transposase
VRFAAIAGWADSGTYPVSFMCTHLGVSRSGYYAWRAAEPSQRSRDDSVLLAIMRKVFEEARGNPGVRRMRAGLAALGQLVSRKRVHRLMQAAGLQGRHPKAWKRTTIGGDKPVPAPDLIGRDFTAALPDARWCGDVTYIKTRDGWAYLATVIDLYSRKVIGWAIAAHMRTSLITAALDMAIAARKPPAGVIFHSDRGCQGGFNRSSQHLDHGGSRWDAVGSSCRSRRRVPVGSGQRIGRCVHRCVRLAGLSPHVRCSGSSGG